MSKIKFELNRKGGGALLKSEEMEVGLMTYASQVQSRAGDGYGTRAYMPGGRKVVAVEAETWDARKDNQKNNTLLKALG